MKSKMILTIGLLAIVLGVATTGIAIQSVQAAACCSPAEQAGRIAASHALLDTYNQILSSQKSGQAAQIITDKFTETIKQLNPFGGPCDLPGQCVRP